MPKTFIHHNEKHMVIEPYDHMLQSNFVADVVKRGGLFGVNLETGKFGVIPENVVKRNNLRNVIDAYILDKKGLAYVGTVREDGTISLYARGAAREFATLFEAYKFINESS